MSPLFLISLLLLSLSLSSSTPSTPGSYLFSILDKDGNGGINWEEWKENKLIDVEPGHGKDLYAIKQLRKVFDRIDVSGDDVIDIDELAQTAPQIFGDYTVKEVHLARTQVDTEMIVMWVTDDNTTTSEVMIGTQNGTYTTSFFGYTTTYDVGALGGWHKIIHTVKLTDLTPNTTYYYQCGDSKGGYSPQYSFTTPPPSSPTLYALVADMGTYIPMGWAVCQQIMNDFANNSFDMVVHAGDIAYAGTGGSSELEEIWDVWAGLVEPFASLIPYMVCIGNHEEYYNATSFMHRFRMPGYESGNTNLWYSINHGNVHWIFFSTQDPYTPGTPQYQWLEQDLIAAQNNRANVPWIIFVTHRPMYCSDLDELDQHEVGASIQVALEPILVQYGVDIYFCGHMHMYERINPVINGTVIQSGNVYNSPNAPMHLVVGTAGAFTDHKYVEPQPAWSASRNGDYGYGRLTVYNNSALHFEFMSEETSDVEDEFWLLK